jgi:hypothetical protein
MAEFFECAMLAAFGLSWPFSIAKTLKAKSAAGKSAAFMSIILAGYLFGIAARLLDGSPANDWLCAVYLADMALVSTDLALCLRFGAKKKPLAAAAIALFFAVAFCADASAQARPHVWWHRMNGNGGWPILEIPAWVKNGGTSPAGRRTFATWRHWTAEDDLLPSGILGPISLAVEEL